MSGMEVAGLAFAVVPIIIEVCRSYRSTKDRLNAFAHHAQIIYDVQLRYRIAATNFNNECQLLLKAVMLDTQDLSEMVENPEHRAWGEQSLEDRFSIFLDRDRLIFSEIVTRIRDVLRETGANLIKHQQGLLTDHSSSRPAASSYRFYEAFNVARKENRHRRWLDELDDWNVRLSKLRSQRYKLHKSRGVRSANRPVPPSYNSIRSASASLLDSLRNSWSCTDTLHIDHQAKLLLEAKVDKESVELDLTITCQQGSMGHGQNQPSTSFLWLHVRTDSPSNAASRRDLPTSSFTHALSTSLLTTPAPRTPSGDNTSANTTKIVSSGDHTPKIVMGPNGSTPILKPDLERTSSICDYISQESSPGNSSTNDYLGYLDHIKASRTLKFLFYTSNRLSAEQKQASPVDGLLQDFDVLHQLTLAYKLAAATLQFHKTSWLSADWTLGDIAYFSGSTGTLSDSVSQHLNSLHFSNGFSKNSALTYDQEQKQMNLKYMYGIRNLPLAKLGVALLEIGHRAELGSLIKDTTPHKVISARKLLSSGANSLMASLGNRYLKIARKCVECDFSCGDDLEDETLQSAVYAEVVCGLEDMLLDWKKFRGLP